MAASRPASDPQPLNHASSTTQTPDWIWMPHAGHLIVGSACRFKLNTYVGKYIVSTVGEWWPERDSREIHAEVYDPKWLTDNQHLLGDYFDHAYMKRFGYMDIGFNRKYETMVFEAIKETDPEAKCCPWTMKSSESLDLDSYNDAVNAYKGHLKLCKKWASKGVRDIPERSKIRRPVANDVHLSPLGGSKNNE